MRVNKLKILTTIAIIAITLLIRLPNKVQAADIKKVNIDGQKVVDFARIYKDLRYQAEISPDKGLDCSGFVTFVYRDYLNTLEWSNNDRKKFTRVYKIDEKQYGKTPKGWKGYISKGKYTKLDGGIEKKDKYGINAPGMMSTWDWKDYLKAEKIPYNKYERKDIEKIKKDSKAGDIILFNEDCGWRNPIHMGIYTGNGNVIHSTSGTASKKYWRVVETPISEVTGKGNSYIDSLDIFHIVDEPKKGNLKIIKHDEKNEKVRLPNVKIQIRRNDNKQWVKADKNNKVTGYVTGQSKGSTFTTNPKGEIYIKGLDAGSYQIYETANSNFGYNITSEINCGSAKVAANSTTYTTKKIKNKKKYGSLEIEKVDSNNTNIKLANVKFKVFCVSNNKWIKRNSNGTVSYVSESGAEEMQTDKYGKITINNLLIGKYRIYEVSNPNEGYTIDEPSKNVTITEGKKGKIQFKDTQTTVKVSGYVWIDKVQEGKETNRNDLYKEGAGDINDVKKPGIAVYLKKGNTEIAKSITNSNGEYVFEKVKISELGNYHIEFEYDGLKYTNVKPYLDKSNGSKAKENINERKEFNNKFAIIEGNTRDTGFAKNKEGVKEYDLKYKLDNHTAELIYDGQYPMKSYTNETNYKLQEKFTTGQKEITNINFGLYEREQPDIALIKDLHSLNLAINGYEHTYLYENRFKHQNEHGNPYDIGVKFGNRYSNMKYTRPIYKSDLKTELLDKNKELKVNLTYKIRIRNESSNLKVKVHNINDFYDSRMNVVNIGTDIEKNGYVNPNKGMLLSNENYNETYKKLKIDISNKIIDPQKEYDVYVQFEMDRKTVLEAINKEINNIVEINAYTVYDKDSQIYAGIDKDSNPGNSEPGNKNTYEDDTDSAPGVILEKAKKERTINGNVFLEESKKNDDDTRSGNGKFDPEDKSVEGVRIQLIEDKPDGKKYPETGEEVKSNNLGEYSIGGFIPGVYKLVFTWENGNKVYYEDNTVKDNKGEDLQINVQDYKSTIVNKTEWEDKEKDQYWYRKNIEERNSDALDNYNTRLAIDEELKKIKHNTQTTKKEMESTTQAMNIAIENTEQNESDGNTNEEQNKKISEITNIDFGIVERARQQLKLNKNVKLFSIAIAKGQEIANVEIDENGNTNKQQYVTYMKPSPTAIPKNGWIKAELDNEILHGAILNTTYIINIKNNSENDYLNQDFYYFGTNKNQDELLKLKPTETIDYLDIGWSYKEENGWNHKKIETDTVSEEVKKALKKIDRNILLKETTEILAPKEKVDLGTLNVSKVLASTDDIELNNESEIITVEKNGGGNLYEETPGNYIPGSYKKTSTTLEPDNDAAETVIVVPATGANKNYLEMGMLGIAILTILGTGIYIIKKKVL